MAPIKNQIKQYAFQIALAALLLVPLQVSAEVGALDDSARPSFKGGYDAEQCASLVGECLRTGMSERLSCLYSTAQHIFCTGGTLGRLAHRRSTLAALPEADAERPLNTKLVDQDCLEKFDNLLSAKLISGALSSESLKELSAALDKCDAPSPSLQP